MTLKTLAALVGFAAVRDAPAATVEGAVRLAAIDRARFEITHVLPSRDIRANPSGAEQIFPSALAEVIRARAGVQP